MIITGKMQKFDFFLIEEACNEGHDIKAKVGSSHLVGTETVKVHSEGCGDWYLFGGYCLCWGLIQATSWEDAYYIYLEEFVPADDMPKDEDELDCGTWDNCGNWYSECTTSYIVGMDTANFDEWEIEITPTKGYNSNE